MQKVAHKFFQRLLKDRKSLVYESSKFSEGQEKCSNKSWARKSGAIPWVWQTVVETGIWPGAMTSGEWADCKLERPSQRGAWAHSSLLGNVETGHPENSEFMKHITIPRSSLQNCKYQTWFQHTSQLSNTALMHLFTDCLMTGAVSQGLMCWLLLCIQVFAKPQLYPEVHRKFSQTLTHIWVLGSRDGRLRGKAGSVK